LLLNNKTELQFLKDNPQHAEGYLLKIGPNAYCAYVYQKTLTLINLNCLAINLCRYCEYYFCFVRILMNIKALIVLICLAAFSNVTRLDAQSTIKGIVLNRQNEPVSQAVIILLREKDSAILQTVLPDSAGNFSIVISESQDKAIKVSAMGYEDEIRRIDSTAGEQQRMDFTLKERTLKEVNIIAARPLYERQTDRLIFNVSASLTAAGSNALDAIKKAPEVMIQQSDYTINLMGKSSVMVLVNDRLIQLSGEDLFAYLQGMSSDNIDRIEIITAPPARYDAVGNSGLINIVLKKNKRAGINGNIRAGYEQASYGKGIAGGDINYRKGNLNLYGSLNYSQGANQVAERLNTPYPGQLFKVNDDYKRILKPLQYTLGADYDIHKNGVLGIQWMSSYANRMDKSHNGIEVLKSPEMSLDSTMMTTGYSKRNNSNNIFHVNYTWNIDTSGKKLTFDANKLWFSGKRNNDFTTVHYKDEFSTPTGVESRNGSDGTQHINITTVQADITLPYSFASLSSGGKLSFIDNKSSNRFGYYDQDGYHEDPLISNSFDYNEKVQALYISAQKSLKKWSFQAGLRGEFTQTKGYSLNLNQTNTNQYFNLFPTAYIQYELNENHNWNLNYSKRINRPDYRSLDPFRAYATPYHYSEGNPFLLPSFNHNLELAYTYKSRFTLSAFYQYEQNHFASVWMVDSVQHITSGINMNFADFISYGINAQGSFQLIRWWELQVQLSLQEQRLQSKFYTSTGQSYKLPTCYAGLNNSFVLNNAKTLLAEVNLFYLSKYREDFLEINALGSVDIGLKALLLDKKFVINISVTDIFATQKARGKHIITGQTIDNYFDTRNVRVSLNYKFGNNKIKAKGERDIGIEEEKRRAG
jgi:hypothetical protein